MKKFVGLRAKTYSYLRDDSSKDKKAKGKKVSLKENVNLKIMKNAQKKLILRKKQIIQKKIKLTLIVLKN